jgi:hypothetical protein
MSAKDRVLGDHKKVGKKLVPPVVAVLPSLTEVSWLDDILPELLWLEVLSDSHGIRRGVELAVRLAQAVQTVRGGFHELAKTSTYALIGAEEWMRVLDGLEPQDVEDLRRALKPFVALYPECPLRGLWSGKLDDLVGHDPDGHVHTQRIALRPIGVEVVQVVTFPLPAV